MGDIKKNIGANEVEDFMHFTFRKLGFIHLPCLGIFERVLTKPEAIILFYIYNMSTMVFTDGFWSTSTIMRKFTGYNRTTQQKARRGLRELGLIEEDYDEETGRTYYSVNNDAMLELLDDVFQSDEAVEFIRDYQKQFDTMVDESVNEGTPDSMRSGGVISRNRGVNSSRSTHKRYKKDNKKPFNQRLNVTLSEKPPLRRRKPKQTGNRKSSNAYSTPDGVQAPRSARRGRNVDQGEKPATSNTFASDKKPTTPPSSFDTKSKDSGSRFRKKVNKPVGDPLYPPKPLNIPNRSKEIIDYWNSHKLLPTLRVNAEDPTKTLKRTLKVLSLFFTGKLYNDHSFANIPDWISPAHLKILNKNNSIDDLKDYIDRWVEVLTCGKYDVNVEYFSRVSLREFLVGNTFVKNDNGGLYAPILTHVILEPRLKVKEKDPMVTKKLIYAWKALPWLEELTGPVESLPKEEFIKAANILVDTLTGKEREYMSTRTDIDGVVGAGLHILNENEWYCNDKSTPTELFNTPWFKRQAKKAVQPFKPSVFRD